MFQANRWAEAFLEMAGKETGAELEHLKTIVLPLKQISHRFSGQSTARRAQELLFNNTGAEFEKTIRFLSIVISKNCFLHIDSIIKAIEKKFDEQCGILNVTVESAAALEKSFEDEIERIICSKTGASGIKLCVKPVPELIAGYRIYINGFFIDASLAGQLKKMTDVLLSNTIPITSVNAAF